MIGMILVLLKSYMDVQQTSGFTGKDRLNSKWQALLGPVL